MTEILIALVALAAMEIVLGIDNIIFIAILTSRLPQESQKLARQLGLGLALISRLLLLCSLSWILGLTAPVLELETLGLQREWIIGAEDRPGDVSAPSAATGHEDPPEANLSEEEKKAVAEKHKLEGALAAYKRDEVWHHINEISVRDLILLLGGLFLIGKSVLEIHERVAHDEKSDTRPKTASFVGVLIQIALLDIIFSLDSVITAVGMVDNLWVMVAAVIIAVGVMLYFAEMVSKFVERNPTIKILALSFLILIGVMLTAEGIGTEINKGYIYFSMAFALVVEVLNIQMRRSDEKKKITATEAADLDRHLDEIASTVEAAANITTGKDKQPAEQPDNKPDGKPGGEAAGSSGGDTR